MNSDNIVKIIENLKERDNFLITSHVNPEGDSIGSQLAMYHILKALNKKAIIVDNDTTPENLKFLPGVDSIVQTRPKDFRPETLVILDCPLRERTGSVCKHVEDDQFIINIDHHISNEFFGDVNWVEPEMSSVGEMIYCLLEKMDLDITKDIAISIYTAIVTDTGMFNYGNTSRRTHEVAGELIAKGVSPKDIFSKIYENKGLHETRLLGRALTTLEVEAEGKLSYMTLTREMYSDENVSRIPTDEFINFPRSIKGVEVAVFFKESVENAGNINVSFRSTGQFDVNTIASRFGGGGHPKASGCVLNASLEEAKEKVLGVVKEMLKKE